MTPTRREIHTTNANGKCVGKRNSITASNNNEEGARTGEAQKFIELDGEVGDFTVVHCLRCHSRHDYEHDSTTRIWQCAFEPSLPSDNADPSRGVGRIVASCGGHMVCLIECESGVVMKRLNLLTSPGADTPTTPRSPSVMRKSVATDDLKETLYTLAWTTLLLNTGSYSNILAVAGKMGYIYLIHPDQLINYDKLDGHTDSINCLLFQTKEPTRLFSGGDDKQIVCWDIGIPNPPTYDNRPQKLFVIRCDDDILNLAYSYLHKLLLITTNTQCKGWTITDRHRSGDIHSDAAIVFDVWSGCQWPVIYKEHQRSKASRRADGVWDGFALLSDDLVASKVSGSGVISLWYISQCLGDAGGDSGPAVRVTPTAHLLWSPSRDFYLYMSSVKDSGFLVCGDSDGRFWLYNVSQWLESDHQLQRKGKARRSGKGNASSPSKGSKSKSAADVSTSIDVYNPSKVYQWADCAIGDHMVEGDTVIVNSVTASSDAQYLVACTEQNILGIYHQVAREDV